MQYHDSIYGEFNLELVFEKIIQTDIFQRLKRIHQGGAIFLIDPKINQTRFEHSIGVMLLIKILNGSQEEQIAGLLHDISHTAFSHLIDYVLENEEEDYHETLFEKSLCNEELEKVLTEFGFKLDAFLDLEQYHLLEYPLPHLSGDRIDYTLRDLFHLGYLKKEEIQWFLKGLLVKERRIVAGNIERAEWFQKQYEILIEDYFKSEDNQIVNLFMKEIIKECMAAGILHLNDFEKDDFWVLNKIEKGKNLNLRAEISKIKTKKNLVGGTLKQKTRTIDPEIWMDHRIIRLSELKN